MIQSFKDRLYKVKTVIKQMSNHCTFSQKLYKYFIEHKVSKSNTNIKYSTWFTTRLGETVQMGIYWIATSPDIIQYTKNVMNYDLCQITGSNTL